MKYQKKPVVIEAVQFLPNERNLTEVQNFLKDTHAKYSIGLKSGKVERILISTLEGIMTASENDYIIKGVHGEFYPCKPDIFEETYEPVQVSFAEKVIGSSSLESQKITSGTIKADKLVFKNL